MAGKPKTECEGKEYVDERESDSNIKRQKRERKSVKIVAQIRVCVRLCVWLSVGCRCELVWV